MSRKFLRKHGLSTLGLGLFFLGLLAHRSYNKDVFNLWSWPYVLVLISAFLSILGITTLRWGRTKRHDLSHSPLQITHAFTEFACLLWGVGYLLNAFDSPTSGGQIADLNAFGTSHPAAALLLWGGLMLGILALAEPILRHGRNAGWGGILLTAWVTILLFLLVEGGLRVRAIVAPETQGFPTYTTELWKRKFVSLNHLGFRDSDHSPLPASGRHRLLVVGDSYAFGWGITDVQRRFGEQLADRLTNLTGSEWEAINASRGDTSTLTHIEYLTAMLKNQPEFVVLLYVFNDIDYLVPVTPRFGPSEHTNSFLKRISPLLTAFRNFFLFQEIYVRLRLISYSQPSNGEDPPDPYQDKPVLEKHLNDLSHFASLANTSNSVVAIVPFEPTVIENSHSAQRYVYFTKSATAVGLPIWPIPPEEYAGHKYEDLIVNKLDRHPNELANSLVAESIAAQFVRKTKQRFSLGQGNLLPSEVHVPIRSNIHD